MNVVTKIRDRFFERLNEKMGWGKEEIKKLYDEVAIEVLMEKLCDEVVIKILLDEVM